jgi:Flp pilus assembly protein TadG
MRDRATGQALAEFAMVFVIFMTLLGATIQFAVILWGQNTLNQVVRDAGRYAATVVDCTPASQADVLAQTNAIAAQAPVPWTFGTPVVTLPTPDSDPCPAVTNGDDVWLTIAADAHMPLFFPWVPGNGHISSSAKFRMEPVNP